MKKNILAGVACATLLWSVTTGCSEETQLASGSDAGYIALALDFDPSPLTGPRGDRSRATSLEITPDDLTLTLTHASGAIPPKIYTVAEFGSQQRVNTGQYTLEAAYGSADSEGWDSPWYYGSQQLTVKNESSTPVNLPVRLANAMVNVTLSKGFTDYMTDYTVTVTTASGTDYVWASDETRRLYVKPGSVMVSIAFTKPNGKQATAQVDPFTAEARHCYNINIDVEAGSAETLRLTFDDTIAEVKDVEIDITDANLPMLAAAPKILTEGFEAGSVIANVSGSAYDGLLKTTIVARGKIDTAVLNVGSSYLRSKGWPESIDLANPGAAQSLLESYGVKTLGLTGNKSVFAVVDFSGLVSKLLYVDGADNTSSFALTVTDLQGKEKTLDLFSVSVERLVLEILDGSIITDNGKATVLLHYNGGNIADVRLYADNDRGTRDLLTVKSASLNAQSGVYTLEVEGKAITAENPVLVRPETDNVAGEKYTLKVPDLRVVEAATNAFATHVYATLDFMNDELLAQKSDVKFEVSTDGGVTYSEVNTTLESDTYSSSSSRVAGVGTSVYHITGLSASTTYTFRARLGNEKSTTASLTTEEAAQLPDAGFDEWTSEKKGDYQYLWKIADGSVWSTVNDLTISTFGSGSGSGGITGGCAYKATSGTIPANGRSTKSSAHGGGVGTTKSGDGHTQGVANLFSDRQNRGNNAALIRTVGWGSGNSAAAGWAWSLKENAGFNTCNTITPGELFLGSCINYIPNYGYQFTSRPSLVSFYYHYDVVTSGNGDYGYAEVIVYDINDNPIAKAETNLYETGSYKLVEMPLTYDSTAKNASKISVRFVSSSNSAALAKDVKFWHTPGSNNTSGGEYVGSELYIDDIVLNY